MGSLGACVTIRDYPYDIDAEQAVLGACLIDREVIITLSTQLESADFWRPAHQAIWRAMLGLFQRRIPIDLVLLTTELRHQRELQDAGGEAYLAELFAATPTAVHAGYYADRVRESAVRRRLIEAARTITAAAFDQTISAEALATQAGEAITKAAMARMRAEYRSMDAVMATVFDDMGKPLEQPMSTGMFELDQIIGGLRRGELMIVAARPSVGKTALGVQFANSLARRGIPVGFISLEMSESGIAKRFIAMNSGVNMHQFENNGGAPGELERVTTAFGKLSDRPVYISDTPDMGLLSVVGRARRMHAERNIAVLIVDYLQLMHVASGGGQRRPENRVQEMTMISGEIKRLGRELNVAVVTLAQLSRANERREDKRPMLSDLRESGSLEQDADIVLFIHRPDRYDPKAAPGIAELIVSKHRNGPTGTARVRFIDRTAEFISLDAWEEAAD